MLFERLNKITARAKGLWQDPWAEIMGLQISKLTKTQCEVIFRNSEGTPSRFLQAAEMALMVVWKKRLRGGLEKLCLTHCNFEMVGETLEQHFVARTEVLENDREEAVVLIFDRQDKLVAQVHYKMKIKSLLPTAIAGGNLK